MRGRSSRNMREPMTMSWSPRYGTIRSSSEGSADRSASKYAIYSFEEDSSAAAAIDPPLPSRAGRLSKEILLSNDLYLLTILVVLSELPSSTTIISKSQLSFIQQLRSLCKHASILFSSLYTGTITEILSEDALVSCNRVPNHNIFNDIY